MSNFTQAASRVQRLCGSHSLLTTAIAEELVNSQHRALLESHPWSRRKQEIIINTVADKSDGTITATNGSPTIDGSSTSFASTDVSRYFRSGSDDSLYVVKTFTSTTSIALGDLNGTSVNYPGTTTAGLSYVLFTRWYSLGTGIEQINSVFYKQRIYERDLEWLNETDPARRATGSQPRYFARGPRDQSGTSDLVRIEFWPRPSSAVSITVDIQKAHTDFSSASTSALIVPSGPVEWFAAVDACYFLFARTKEQKWLALASEYKGEARTSLEFEKSEDQKKFGLSQAVKDRSGGVGLANTDFALDHDVG